MSTDEKQFDKMNGIILLELPLDILSSILQFLDAHDLVNLMRTCKTLKNYIKSENALWRRLGRLRVIIQNPIDSDPDTLPWYNRCKISNNWCKGIYINQISLHHDTCYMPWLECQNAKNLLLSLGSKLLCFPTINKGVPNCRSTLWELNVPTIRRYDIRTNDISRFIVKENIILCGNRDGCVAVYQFNNLNRKPLLLCHINDCHDNGQVEVTAVEGIKTPSSLSVITGSLMSCHLSMWTWNLSENEYEYMYEEMQNMNCRKTSKELGNDVGVRSLAMNPLKDKIAIGPTGTSQPLLIDHQTFDLLIPVDKTKKGKYAIRDIQWHDENTLAYVSHSGILQLLDIRTNNVVFNAMDPFQSSLYCVRTDGNNSLIVGASEYSRCVLFDKRRHSSHVQMYYTQKKSSPIYSLAFNSSKLITASDRSIALVDFEVNPAAVRRRDYSHVFEFIKR